MYNNQLEHVFFHVLNDTFHTSTIEKWDISACIFFHIAKSNTICVKEEK